MGFFHKKKQVIVYPDLMSTKAILVDLKDAGEKGVRVLDSIVVEPDLEMKPFSLIEEPEPNAEIVQNSILPEIKKTFKLHSGDKATVVIPDLYNVINWLTLPDVDAHKLSMNLSDLVLNKTEPLLPHELDRWFVSYYGYADREKNNYLVSAILKVALSSIKRAFRKNRLDVVSFQPATLALDDLVSRYSVGSELQEDDAVKKRAENIAVVHIGEESTTILAYRGGELHFARVVSFGQKKFINTLIKQMNLDAKEAKSFLYEAVIFENAPAIDQNKNKNYNTIKPVFGELIKELYESLTAYLARHREFKMNALLVCGPVSTVPNIGVAIENRLNIPTKPLSQLCYQDDAPVFCNSAGVSPKFINEFAVLLGACFRNEWDYLGKNTVFTGRDPYSSDFGIAVKDLKKKISGVLKHLSPSPKPVAPKLVDNSGYVVEEKDGHKHICRDYSGSGTDFLELVGGVEDATTGLTISHVRIDNIARMYTAKDITNLAKSGTDIYIKTKNN